MPLGFAECSQQGSLMLAGNASDVLRHCSASFGQMKSIMAAVVRLPAKIKRKASTAEHAISSAPTLSIPAKSRDRGLHPGFTRKHTF